MNYIEAKAQAQKLRSSNTKPDPNFQDGTEVTIHGRKALILSHIFSPAVWMYSYKYTFDGDSAVREIMEWAIG